MRKANFVVTSLFIYQFLSWNAQELLQIPSACRTIKMWNLSSWWSVCGLVHIQSMRHDEISNINVASLQCSNVICTGCVLIDFTSNGVFPMQVTYPAALPQVTWSLDDLPRVVACSLTQGSNVTSMDFHPSHHTVLLGMTPFFDCILGDGELIPRWLDIFNLILLFSSGICKWWNHTMGDWSQRKAGVKAVQSMGNGCLFTAIPGLKKNSLLYFFNSTCKLSVIYSMWWYKYKNIACGAFIVSLAMCYCVLKCTLALIYYFNWSADIKE